MSPSGPGRGKMAMPDNLYTVLLASSFVVTLAALIFVLCMCYVQYGTLIKAASP